MHTRKHTTTHDAHGEGTPGVEGRGWLRRLSRWMAARRARRCGHPTRLSDLDGALDLIARRALETDYPRGQAYYLELYLALYRTRW
jgi:hypothetical protein